MNRRKKGGLRRKIGRLAACGPLPPASCAENAGPPSGTPPAAGAAAYCRFAFFLAPAFLGAFLVAFFAAFVLGDLGPDFFLAALEPPKMLSQLSANFWVDPTRTTLILLVLLSSGVKLHAG